MHMYAFNFCAALPPPAAACTAATASYYSHAQSTVSLTRAVRRPCRASADPPFRTNKTGTTGKGEGSTKRGTGATKTVLEMTRVVVLAGAILGCIFLIDVILGAAAVALAFVYGLGVVLGVRNAAQWPRRFASGLSLQVRKLSLRVRGLRRRFRRK